MINFVLMRPSIKQIIYRYISLSLIILVYTAFFQAMYCWMRYDTITAGVDLLSWLYSLLVNYIPILVLSIGIVTVCRYTLRLKSLGEKIAIDLFSVFVMLVAVNCLFKFITGMDFNWGGSIFNGMMVLLGIEFWLLSEQKQKALMRENLLAKENMTMRYEIQKAYVNPHFLYNSLDMLSSLIEEEKNEESLNFIIRLSYYYRAMTRKMNMPVTTMSEELEMVRNYLDIEKYHYGKGLSFQVVNNTDDDPTIIPFSLQLLVENVLKHNIISPSLPIKILITVDDTGITISNNCNKKVTARHKGVGMGLSYLKNVYSYHGKELIIEETPTVFKVTLPNLKSE